MIIAFDWDRLRELLWRPRVRLAWGAAFAAFVLLVAVQLAAGGSGGRPVHHVAAGPERSKVVDTTTYVPRPVAEQHLATLLQRWTHLRSWLRRHGVATPVALLALPADVFSMPVTHIKVVVPDPDPNPASSIPAPAISPSPDFTSPSPTAAPSPSASPSPTVGSVNATASP